MRDWKVCIEEYINKILRKRPFIFYMHPYELDHNEFDYLEFEVPFFTRIHQGFGRKHFLRKIAILFNTFDICTFRDIINNGSTSFPDLNISILK